MTVISTALKHMLAAGMPHDAIVAAVAEMEASMPAAVDPVAERRRAYDRERKRNAKRNSTGIPPEAVESAERPEADPLPLPPNEIKSNPPTPAPENITPRAKADPFPCPDGVDPTDWDGLKANRKTKRAALTEGAHRQITKKLDAWARDGWPPGPIVATAAERGWTTVFETDEMKAANGNGNGSNRNGAPGNSGGRDRRDGFARACDDELATFEAQRSAPSGAEPDRRLPAPGATAL